jgi:hypothetical protein
MDPTRCCSYRTSLNPTSTHLPPLQPSPLNIHHEIHSLPPLLTIIKNEPFPLLSYYIYMDHTNADQQQKGIQKHTTAGIRQWSPT